MLIPWQPRHFSLPLTLRSSSGAFLHSGGTQLPRSRVKSASIYL
jgi:hypothetical protein